MAYLLKWSCQRDKGINYQMEIKPRILSNGRKIYPWTHWSDHYIERFNGSYRNHTKSVLCRCGWESEKHSSTNICIEYHRDHKRKEWMKVNSSNVVTDFESFMKSKEDLVKLNDIIYDLKDKLSNALEIRTKLVSRYYKQWKTISDLHK